MWSFVLITIITKRCVSVLLSFYRSEELLFLAPSVSSFRVVQVAFNIKYFKNTFTWFMCKTVTFTGCVITCTSVYLVTSWKINAFSWNGQWCDHVPCVLNTSKRTVWDSIQENFRKSSSLSSGTELTDFGFVGVAQSFFKPCGVHTLQKKPYWGMSLKVFGQLLNFPRNLLHRSPRCDKKLFKACTL